MDFVKTPGSQGSSPPIRVQESSAGVDGRPIGASVSNVLMGPLGSGKQLVAMGTSWPLAMESTPSQVLGSSPGGSSHAARRGK